MNPAQREHPSSPSVKTKALRILWANIPRLILAVIIGVIVLLMIVIKSEKQQLMAEKAAGRAQESIPVNTVLLDLKPSTIKDVINLPGMIEPWTRLELMAKIHGSVIEVLAQEGSPVKQGEILARIEPDDYRIALESARASFALAKAQYERGRLMLGSKTIPQAELDKYQAQMQTANAAMEDAELRLSRCVIRAPMNGIIRRLDAKVGLLLSIGDPIAEILQIDRVKAVVGIPETDVAAVRRIDEVTLTIQALNNREVTGRKFFLASSPSSTARLYPLELELDNPDRAILPGMFFRAQVIKETVANALAVPLYSVITRNKEQFVFVARDGVVHKQPVKLGIVEQWQVQVTEGLKPGDQVVVEGHRDVEDGQQVRVIHVITDPGKLSQ